MISNVAYCGLKCDECPAYLAKLENNDELRRETLEKWGSPEYPLEIKDINCDGCKAPDGVHFKFCGSCTVRQCASEKGVETCAHCPDYGCATLQEWLSHAGDTSKKILEDLRDIL